MNWFKPVCAQPLESIDLFLFTKKYGHIKLQFSFILCKIDFESYLDKYPNIHSNHIMIFRVGAEMYVIVMDFSKKNP